MPIPLIDNSHRSDIIYDLRSNDPQRQLNRVAGLIWDIEAETFDESIVTPEFLEATRICLEVTDTQLLAQPSSEEMDISNPEAQPTTPATVQNYTSGLLMFLLTRGHASFNQIFTPNMTRSLMRLLDVPNSDTINNALGLFQLMFYLSERNFDCINDEFLQKIYRLGQTLRADNAFTLLETLNKRNLITKSSINQDFIGNIALMLQDPEITNKKAGLSILCKQSEMNHLTDVEIDLPVYTTLLDIISSPQTSNEDKQHAASFILKCARNHVIPKEISMNKDFIRSIIRHCNCDHDDISLPMLETLHALAIQKKLPPTAINMPQLMAMISSHIIDAPNGDDKKLKMSMFILHIVLMIRPANSLLPQGWVKDELIHALMQHTSHPMIVAQFSAWSCITGCIMHSSTPLNHINFSNLYPNMMEGLRKNIDELSALIIRTLGALCSKNINTENLVTTESITESLKLFNSHKNTVQLALLRALMEIQIKSNLPTSVLQPSFFNKVLSFVTNNQSPYAKSMCIFSLTLLQKLAEKKPSSRLLHAAENESLKSTIIAKTNMLLQNQQEQVIVHVIAFLKFHLMNSTHCADYHEAISAIKNLTNHENTHIKEASLSFMVHLNHRLFSEKPSEEFVPYMTQALNHISNQTSQSVTLLESCKRAVIDNALTAQHLEKHHIRVLEQIASQTHGALKSSTVQLLSALAIKKQLSPEFNLNALFENIAKNLDNSTHLLQSHSLTLLRHLALLDNIKIARSVQQDLIKTTQKILNNSGDVKLKNRASMLLKTLDQKEAALPLKSLSNLSITKKRDAQTANHPEGSSSQKKSKSESLPPNSPR